MLQKNLISRKLIFADLSDKNNFADRVRKKPNFVELILFLAFFLKICGKTRKNVISRNLFSRIWQNKKFRGCLPKKTRK